MESNKLEMIESNHSSSKTGGGEVETHSSPMKSFSLRHNLEEALSSDV